jgi:hypothetical protein
LTGYVPAEERGGFKVKVLDPAVKVTHVGIATIDIEQVSDSGSFMVGRS